MVEGHLDPRARRHGGDDAAHDRAAEGLAGGHQRVAQAEALVQLGRIAAGGQAEARLSRRLSRIRQSQELFGSETRATNDSQERWSSSVKVSRPGQCLAGGDEQWPTRAGRAVRCRRCRATCARPTGGVHRLVARRAPSGGAGDVLSSAWLSVLLIARADYWCISRFFKATIAKCFFGSGGAIEITVC